MSFMFLRGQRILDQLNEVSNVTQLQQNIEVGFPATKKRQHATGEVTVQGVEYIAYRGMKMLHIRSTTTSNGNAYRQSMQFMRVEFFDSDGPDVVTFKGTDGISYHIKPIALSVHNTKVKCNCMDFHHRFAHYNSQDKSLVGRPPPPYQRKTNRPPVNPDRVPGMCKHLLKLVQTLQQYGIVTD